MLALSATQTITPRHTVRYGHSSFLNRNHAAHHNAVNSEERTMKRMYVQTHNSRALMRVDGESVARLRSRKRRCRLGLECNCGKYGRRERARAHSPRRDTRRSCSLLYLKRSTRLRATTNRISGPSWRRRGASAEAAAIEAAYVVLSTYFPASASTLNADRANSLASIPDGQAKNDGIATGDAAALAMIALRANDGSSPAAIQNTRPTCSRRMAGDTELPDCEWNRVWNRLSMAERNSVRHPECQ